MVNSGSSANLLLVSSLLYRTNKEKIILKKGDEVIVPSLAWSTTVSPLIQLGLKPIIVDINLNSLAIDLESAQRVISKRTKAMFLIHVLGQACNMDIYSKFCKKNKLVLIEDCCESFGSFYKSKTIGSFGVGGTFSHFFSHHLTTIEGGTIITNDNDLANDLRSLRAHGWARERKDKKKVVKNNQDSKYFFILPGYNVRPTEINASIGNEQIKKIETNLKQRDLVVKNIIELFRSGPDWLKIIGSEFILDKKLKNRNQRKHSWMNIPILILEKKIPVNYVRDCFEKFGIETRPIISGNILKHPLVENIKIKKDKELKNVNLIHNKGFMIGCHHMIDDKAYLAIKKVITFLNKY